MSAGVLEKNRVLETNAVLATKRRRIEYGDFQTPPDLAREICRVLRSERPKSLIEPTCGTGAFLSAALECFRQMRRALGFEVNSKYVAAARRSVAPSRSAAVCRVRAGNFFEIDWDAVVAECAEPMLILGNPPWVTNSVLGVLGSVNLPPKQNLPGRTGLEGLTGKSNFDVSEWMIFRLLQSIAGRRATLAMLCKTAVARRVLARAWEGGLSLDTCEMRPIDALRHFEARVDACLLVCRTQGGSTGAADCRMFESLESSQSPRAFGWRDGRLIADLAAYDRNKHLLGGPGQAAQARWRSGIKHDCSAVFEFRKRPTGELINGLGEVVDLEPDYLFPLVKSSDVAGARQAREALSDSDGRMRGEGSSLRWMLVPQRRVGKPTEPVRHRAPKTWRYLQRHAERLDRRASRVYEKQPRFSIFGVGPYSFARWKVIVSGFYKMPRFVAVGPVRGRPVVCDDTCYFLPCATATEARSLARLLNGPRGRDFFSAFVFADAKRPLTAEILGSLDLGAFARSEN